MLRPFIRITSLCAIFCWYVMTHDLFACSAFVLKNDGAVLLAKNLDWPVADGFIVENPRSLERKTSDGFTWKSQYGSITFNQFGDGHPLGGMNESGLVIEELNYTPSIYPDPGEIILNEFQWIQYHLDMTKNVQELVASLDRVTIRPVLTGLHYLIADRNGDMAIIEFIEGQTKVYTDDDIPYPALTNNTYPNALKYLAHHRGFGGTRMETNGPESPERFVRIARGLKDLNTRSEDIIGQSFAVLNSVQQNDTQWSIVYDLSEASIHFKLKDEKVIRSFQMSDLDLQFPREVFILGHPSTPKIQFSTYDRSLSKDLVNEVLNKLQTLGIISAKHSLQLESILTAQ